MLSWPSPSPRYPARLLGFRPPLVCFLTSHGLRRNGTGSRHSRVSIQPNLGRTPQSLSDLREVFHLVRTPRHNRTPSDNSNSVWRATAAQARPPLREAAADGTLTAPVAETTTARPSDVLGVGAEPMVVINRRADNDRPAGPLRRHRRPAAPPTLSPKLAAPLV
jgi:hypothetical protein